jgi:hypothetical protein
MQVITPEEVRDRGREEYETEDGVSYVTHYFGPPDRRETDEASAFLVQYRPHAGHAIRPHFHKIAQFQVIVAGDGRIGKVPVPPISFQYADPSTPYGPIKPVDDEEGIDFLTLRPAARKGIWFMPGNKHEMSGRAGRNLSATIDPSVPLPERGSQSEDLIESGEDGLAGYALRLAPDAAETVAAPPGSGGQYHLVTRGPLRVADREVDRMALLFVDAGEEITYGAGPDGGEVVVMQFPERIEP